MSWQCRHAAKFFSFFRLSHALTACLFACVRSFLAHPGQYRRLPLSFGLVYSLRQLRQISCVLWALLTARRLRCFAEIFGLIQAFAASMYGFVDVDYWD